MTKKEQLIELLIANKKDVDYFDEYGNYDPNPYWLAEEIVKLFATPDVSRSFSEDELKAYVIKLRKRHHEIKNKQLFYQSHNFKLESESKKSEAETVLKIIHETEDEFDLGFVWDDSLS